MLKMNMANINIFVLLYKIKLLQRYSNCDVTVSPWPFAIEITVSSLVRTQGLSNLLFLFVHLFLLYNLEKKISVVEMLRASDIFRFL